MAQNVITPPDAKHQFNAVQDSDGRDYMDERPDWDTWSHCASECDHKQCKTDRKYIRRAKADLDKWTERPDGTDPKGPIYKSAGAASAQPEGNWFVGAAKAAPVLKLRIARRQGPLDLTPPPPARVTPGSIKNPAKPADEWKIGCLPEPVVQRPQRPAHERWLINSARTNRSHLEAQQDAEAAGWYVEPVKPAKAKPQSGPSVVKRGGWPGLPGKGSKLENFWPSRATAWQLADDEEHRGGRYLQFDADVASKVTPDEYFGRKRRDTMKRGKSKMAGSEPDTSWVPTDDEVLFDPNGAETQEQQFAGQLDGLENVGGIWTDTAGMFTSAAMESGSWMVARQGDDEAGREVKVRTKFDFCRYCHAPLPADRVKADHFGEGRRFTYCSDRCAQLRENWLRRVRRNFPVDAATGEYLHRAEFDLESVHLSRVDCSGFTVQEWLRLVRQFDHCRQSQGCLRPVYR